MILSSGDENQREEVEEEEQQTTKDAQPLQLLRLHELWHCSESVGGSPTCSASMLDALLSIPAFL